MGWGECVKKVSELPISEVLVCVSVKCTVYMGVCVCVCVGVCVCARVFKNENKLGC